MGRFICLTIVYLSILLSACASTEPTWIIPGDLGTRHQWAGKLSDAGDAKIASIRIHVTGLGPPSPSSAARDLYLTLTCTGTAASQLRWHVEPTQPDAPDGSSNVACGEATSIFADYESDRRVILELAAGVSGEVEYTLTAYVHLPY